MTKSLSYYTQCVLHVLTKVKVPKSFETCDLNRNFTRQRIRTKVKDPETIPKF